MLIDLLNLKKLKNMNTINLLVFSTEEEKKRMRVDELSFDFAKRIVFLRKYLTTSVDNKEFVMSKQVLRSGTSIGDFLTN